MNVLCPICQKEKDVNNGKYICSNCDSKFEVYENGNIELIKSNKFDYWILFLSLTIPLLFIGFLVHELYTDKFNFSSWQDLGFVLLFYPILIMLRQLFFNVEMYNLIGLYIEFFKGQLHKQDGGKIIGFYVTFVTNITGLILIVSKAIN